jgi:hypothetical protein
LCHTINPHKLFLIAIYNRAVESLFWIEDVVDDLSRTMNNHDASTIRRKKERTYRELEKEYKRRLLRAKEDRVADEKELMRIDGVAQSENIDGLVNFINYVLYPKKRFNSPIVNG